MMFQTKDSDGNAVFDFEVVHAAGHLGVEMWYPERDDKGMGQSEIHIGLMDIRAADSILVRYDYNRDGWMILQASVFEWDIDDEKCDPGWKEAAFIPAWQFESQEAGDD